MRSLRYGLTTAIIKNCKISSNFQLRDKIKSKPLKNLKAPTRGLSPATSVFQFSTTLFCDFHRSEPFSVCWMNSNSFIKNVFCGFHLHCNRESLHNLSSVWTSVVKTNNNISLFLDNHLHITSI